MDLTQIDSNSLRKELNRRENIRKEAEKQREIDERNDLYFYLEEAKLILAKFLNKNGMSLNSAKEFLVIRKDKLFDNKISYSLLFKPECANNDYTKAIYKLIKLFHETKKPHTNYISFNNYKNKPLMILHISHFKKEGLKVLKEKIKTL